MKKHRIVAALAAVALSLTACTSSDNSTPAPTPAPDSAADRAVDHAESPVAPAPGNGTPQDNRGGSTLESTIAGQTTSGSALDVRMDLVAGYQADKTGKNRFSILTNPPSTEARIFMPIWEASDDRGSLTGETCTVDFEWLTLDGDVVATGTWADCSKTRTTIRESLELHDYGLLPRKGSEETYTARLTFTSPDGKTTVIEDEVLVRHPN